jgi:hypothetical protein
MRTAVASRCAAGSVGRRTARFVPLLAFVLGAVPGGAHAARLEGTVASGRLPIAGASVELHATRAGARGPGTLASSTTGSSGTFSFSYRQTRPERVLYLTVRMRGAVRLAAVLGGARVRRIVVNERTTIAAGFALAQFLSRDAVSGRTPGPQNAALMAQNLADLRTGQAARALRRAPNGGRTSTLRTFNSLANLVVRCVREAPGCGRFLRLAAPPRSRPPRGTLQAIANIARNPWQHVAGLFRLARTGPRPYRPALRRSQEPDAWTLAVRFVGDGRTMNGPGNFAFDADGNAYVANNYVFSRKRLEPVCGSDLLLKFAPNGRYFPGTPFQGGGLSGVGYGLTLDPDGNIWAGNFGFAAPGCDNQPLHNSISKFSPGGRALSPPSGFTAGNISWPQGTVSDRKGNIWLANCGNSTVTQYPDGRTDRALSFDDLGIVEPFDIAINQRGQAFVTGNNSDNVAMLNPDGSPTFRSPISGAGIVRPMGIAVDSRGNMWVASSHLLDVPCPGPVMLPPSSELGGSVALISSRGLPLTRSGFKGGGLTVPWGISVDGDDNVWVGNFAGKRVSQFCGTRPASCPPGIRTGDPISPDRTGYGFDGLTRTTGLEPDPSGNLWVTNNWKEVPLQTNPGGYQIVIFVGIAAPIRTPVIGPPRR